MAIRNRLFQALYHEGRFCPIKAFRGRRHRGPVDWVLLALLIGTLALGAWRATLFYFTGN